MRVVPRRNWASGASIASGVAMAALPKCPACFAVYFGFLSAFGIDRWAPDYLWPLTYALFGASVVFLGFRAWRESNYGPLVIALAGASILVASRMIDAAPAALWIGCAFFLVGVFWSARQSPGANAAPCHTTKPEGACS